MVFSSPLFLFLFLPIVLGLYAVCPARLKNSLLLGASLIFYGWGDPAFLPIMGVSIAINYGLALGIDRVRGTRWTRPILVVAVAANLGMLGYYKYAGFLIDNVNALLASFGLAGVKYRAIVLPLGISFFTFHGLSYVIDIYRGNARAERNPLNVALYIALFPQLIAGPIIRYSDIAAELIRRTVTRAEFAIGVRRFIVGLAKKVLIANTVGATADAIFALDHSALGMDIAWLGVFCFALQLYFDFSGYSDMAIGLALMFGFHFKENFNYPHAATSITDFWRRWHISLSTWFRDYLYIPLGGNRVPPRRVYANLVAVFALCGLWHGASWNFLLWGLYHGLFLVIERIGLRTSIDHAWRPLRHAYVILAVLVGLAIFRSTSIAQIGAMLSAMAGLSGVSQPGLGAATYLNLGLGIAITAGIVGSLPVVPWCAVHAERWLAAHSVTARRFRRALAGLYQLGAVTAHASLLAASAVVLSASTYNPFIYYRF